MDRLATFSSTDPDAQGITRLPFTAQQVDAARWLCRRMTKLGLTARADAFGTVAGFLPGQSSDVLVLGSHYDSVPCGGRYDGCAGVAVALDLVSRLRDAGQKPRCSLLVLALNDEEGVRLSEGFLSSRSVCGFLSEADLQRIHDCQTGESLAQLLHASPLQGAAVCLPENARAYIEFHVEQGPVLYEKALSTAVVEHIVGVYHCFYTLRGGQNHAGTTPMDSRRDPVPVFGRIAAALPDITQGLPHSVATVGFAEFNPNAPNVIAGSLRFSVDLRSADPAQLEQLQQRAQALVIREAESVGLELEKFPSTDAPPVTMSPALVDALDRCTLALGLPLFHMDSGAGHDAQIFAQKLPTAMLFARSRKGLSHCKDEFTLPEDLQNACNILFELIKEEH